ncbi:MAG TPA: BlaI/MecI/CopY family transcriptional regulator [Thermoleophilia bacterium]|jgi:predicted transcriptional regulator|nr:BlaI/MecI/CopY family transcriptional regulator [Thermoleophilia bacterium]
MEEARPKWLRSTKGAPFTGIGSLEADILAVVWEKDRTTVRAVYETLRERRTIAYTTVMTVMNNLVKKHLLDQDKSGIAYVYTPAIPGREVGQTVLESVVHKLINDQTGVAVAMLLGLEEDLTPEQTDELRAWARREYGG